MGAIDNIKDVAKLLQTLGNTEVYQKMIAVPEFAAAVREDAGASSLSGS